MASDAPGPDRTPFPYMRWARQNLGPGNPNTLGLSGIARPEGPEVAGLLPATLPDGRDPEPVLMEAVARRCGTTPDHVHLTLGTSTANLLVYLAFARGGRVVAETPAYQSLHGLAAAVGGSAVPFARRFETGWRVDADSLRRAATPGTRLIAVTDLHNPSGARLVEEDIALLIETAERVGALLLVDEVYAEFDPVRRPTAALRDPRVLVTNSLTKVHGLGDLRCGWILGAPDRIRELVGWDDLVCPSLPRITMIQALEYLPHADRFAAATRARAAAHAETVDRWVRSRSDVRWRKPDGGITGLVLLGASGRPIDGDEVARRLLSDHGVQVVPGSFFQVPDSLRISFGIDAPVLGRCLDALGRTLDAISASAGQPRPVASSRPSSSSDSTRR